MADGYLHDSPYKIKEDRWRHYRIDCVLAIIDQAKFIKNSMESEYESEESVIKYINELVEMVATLKRFTEE